MNCYQHSEAPATAYCRSCGRPLCERCQRPAEGTVFCPEHAPVAAGGSAPPSGGAFDSSNPYVAGTTASLNSTGLRTSPALAFILGWIPGVGAIYNGQYIKGLVHALVFGLLVSLADSNGHNASGPFLGIMLAAFIFYMAFEAYHTAKKRQMGIAVAEWSSLAGSQSRFPVRTPAGPILLIVIGVLFLLDTLHLVEFREIGRFWPVILIVAGAAMLYSRACALSSIPPPSVPPVDFTGSNPSAGNANSILEVRRGQ
ncbi:MAG: B-box zinc finger protein [Acidobacteriaceae bacterium]|nr:B-box zinc finger protein [Acidobacteriaceae bacterium]MBV9936999.1 B-box zinc finger protein [Acidobacteriaceae bacterium]